MSYGKLWLIKQLLLKTEFEMTDGLTNNRAIFFNYPVYLGVDKISKCLSI